ncbi:MAG: response regulator [Gammaproteobacteria bacterium]
MSTSSPNFRIIVADDHALVRGGLVQLVMLVEENVEIFESNDFGQTLDLLSKGQAVGVLLLDLLMPGMEGVDGIVQICKQWPDVPVIVVSAKENIAAIRSALAAGAMGYIPKTSSPDVMMSAIKLVLSGGVYVPPHVLGTSSLSEERMQEQNITSEAFGLSAEQGYEQLTERQQEVLDLMALGKSNKDIADDLGLTTGTVKMHSSRIFKTLNVQNRTEAVAKFAQHKKDKEPI